jgi:osmotically inducible lipoprotein OsmB
MRTGASIQQFRGGKRVTFLLMAITTSLALMSGGCTMNDTQKRVGTGAAIGALGGALLGSSRESALIGAAVGAAGGYMVDQHKKRDDAESDNNQLRAENERLRLEAENQRLKEQAGQ